MCLLLFTSFSTVWVYSLENERDYTKQLKPLIRLESLLPQHKLQLLNANFSDQLHYDNFAQLQSEIENTLLVISVDSKTASYLKGYAQTSLNYIQLVSMLKTSQRLISHNERSEEEKLQKKFDGIRLRLFSFITHPHDKLKVSIINRLEDINLKRVSQEQRQYAQLFKLHCLFILENLEQTAVYRHSLISMPVTAKVTNEVLLIKAKVNEAKLAHLVSLFGVILSLLLLFLAILMRQHFILKQTSTAHQKALEVKSQFLANMSHEIRTPMTGVIGLVDLTLQTELSGEQQGYLEKVEFAAKSLLTIINDILDFSKIESGQLSIENTVWDHNKLIDNLLVMVGKTAQEKDVELIFDIDPMISKKVMGDPVRVNQIILNLLSNAIKFTEQGFVILRATLSEDKNYKDHHRVIYSITDTGIGLSAQQQAKLFKRFNQADESTTRKYGGTGLGLAISKLLVELMEGEITITSEVGKGSTFSVNLPYKKANSELLKVQIKTYQGTKILLLEDNTCTQYVIEKMALHLQASIDVTTSVAEAVAHCKANSYDLALIDWKLSDECGLDFIQHVYDRPESPKELVICSAYEQSYIEKSLDKKLQFSFLTKPLTLHKLENLLGQLSAEKVKPISNESLPKIKPLCNEALQQNSSESASSLILLVEDNKINQIVATKLLSRLGLTIDIAEDGVSAINKIKENNYRVVLMDIQMPVMDGVAATIELRKYYTSEELIIIALTANITGEEIDYYQQIGMNGYLGKPYEIEKIREILSKYYTLQ